MDRERDDQGRYSTQITPERVLEVLSEAETPVLTARQVAEELGCSSEAARQKLLALHEAGDVGKMSVGARAVVWWREDS
ncbi:HTH domain-containing protein [Haloferax sp. Atlit-47N]|uniref:HTH domain-containing protein n=1 Tax=Haloferax volcanii TaxID=2246 RepID=A0A847TWD0_HALVO|nr:MULTISPECIES: HTH domain-containing protein [Haloferax]NLV03620.1 HTH domain-containing protein [Haloferax alexandrinus]RDZ39011.1 HTH domain-containing protein [Haloferax sp. Atlit-47N]